MTARVRDREEPAVLKRRYPLAEVVARAGVALRRVGERLVGRCPFHADDTPSFTIYPDQASYHCFGCGAHGDVFTFVMAIDRCDFPTAVARLTGGDLSPAPRALPTTAEPALTARQQAILTTVARAYAADLDAARDLDAALATAPVRDHATVTALQQAPIAPGADAALSYLRGRGVRDAVLGPALVGWCSGGRLAELAAAHGWAADEPRALGLTDRWGRERLSGRVTVPEFRDNRCVWLTGRRIGPDRPGRPKYLGVRAPRQALGLERARRQPTVIVVEGVVDYLVGLGWGLPVLALGGLGLRPGDLAALRDPRQIILLLDADRAGQAEARRLAGPVGAPVSSRHRRQPRTWLTWR